jgi:RNA polymerase sigma factor (sigma-70 family)
MKNMELALTAMAETRNRTIQEAVTQYGKKLFDFIRFRVASPEDAEDVLQDVYFQFSRALENPEPIEKVSSWLFTAARNRIIDFYRKKKTEPFSSFRTQESEDDDTLLEPFDFLTSEGNTPEDEYTKKLFWEVLEEGLEELPEEQREVFEMHELQGLSFNDIAQMTGEPLKTLLSRKHYAVKRLREHLRDYYNETLNN